MSPQTGFFAVLLGATIGSVQVTPARATDDDIQFRMTGAAVLPLDERIEANLEVELRWREEEDQVQTRGAIEFKLSESVALSGGASFIGFASGHEFRPHQQVNITAGPLAFRTRIEGRFFEGADRPEIRLRQRVQLSWPVTQGTTAALSGEVLYIARSRTPGEADRIDQWRAQALLRHRLSAHLEVGVSYILMLSPRDGAPDRLSHVPQLTLTFRP